MRGQLAAIALLAALGTPAFCQDAPAATDEAARAVVVVKATWPGQDLERTTFYVYADAGLKERLHVFPADAGRGAALMMLTPGEYYLMAIVDLNGSKKPDAGDGFGFYGVDSISAETRPQPLKVVEGEPQTAIVEILMVMDAEGHLVPVERTAEEAGRVVGTVTGAGELQALVLLLPADEGLEPLACLVGQDGSFQLQARPGTYGVIAVADADKSGSVTDQDLVGWKGQENPEGPDDLTVRPGETVDAGEIALSVKELLGEADRRPAVLAGRVTGAELARAARVAVSLYSDEKLKNLVTTVRVGADAGFCVALEPGTYYAKATVDLEGDGRLSAGDMLGFFGVADIMSGERPQPLALGMGELRVEVVIPLTAQLDDEGKLVAIKAANDAAEDAE